MLSGTMRIRASLLLLLAACVPAAAVAQPPAPAATTAAPVRVAIAGLVHGHVTGFMRQLQGRTADMALVGVYEPDAALRRRSASATSCPRTRCSRRSTSCCSG